MSVASRRCEDLIEYLSDDACEWQAIGETRDNPSAILLEQHNHVPRIEGEGLLQYPYDFPEMWIHSHSLLGTS